MSDMFKNVKIKENHMVIVPRRVGRASSSLISMKNTTTFSHHFSMLEYRDVEEMALDDTSNGSRVWPTNLHLKELQEGMRNMTTKQKN